MQVAAGVQGHRAVVGLQVQCGVVGHDVLAQVLGVELQAQGEALAIGDQRRVVLQAGQRCAVARQQVAERFANVKGDLPDNVSGGLAPISTPLWRMPG